jgi:hypothetical protein
LHVEHLRILDPRNSGRSAGDRHPGVRPAIAPLAPQRQESSDLCARPLLVCGRPGLGGADLVPSAWMTHAVDAESDGPLQRDSPMTVHLTTLLLAYGESAAFRPRPADADRNRRPPAGSRTAAAVHRRQVSQPVRGRKTKATVATVGLSTRRVPPSAEPGAALLRFWTVACAGDATSVHARPERTHRTHQGSCGEQSSG